MPAQAHLRGLNGHLQSTTPSGSHYVDLLRGHGAARGMMRRAAEACGDTGRRTADARLPVDSAMVKALARAFRWRRMLDTGLHATLEDLARAKGVAPSYVSRVLRLTLLAPEIVEAILDGRQPAELQLADLLEGFPLEWAGQSKGLGIKGPRRQE